MVTLLRSSPIVILVFAAGCAQSADTDSATRGARHAGGNLVTDIDARHFEAGAAALAHIREQGRIVFSTPFNVHDGFGDGDVDDAAPGQPGGRPTLAGAAAGFLRLNGLDAQSCLECHSIRSTAAIPADFAVGGVGGGAAMAMPATTEFLPGDVDDGDPTRAVFDGRAINPPFVFGSGGVELLAKEITRALQRFKRVAAEEPGRAVPLVVNRGDVRLDFGSITALPVTAERLQALAAAAESSGDTVSTNCEPTAEGAAPSLRDFIGKRRPPPEVFSSDAGVFGTLAAFRAGGLTPDLTFDYSNVRGVNRDLVVKPFGRKGDNVTTRDFDCGAMRFHMGIEPVELFAGDHDNDGVVNEATVAEMSALAVFNTTSPKPRDATYDGPGVRLFAQAGCADCHVPSMVTDSAVLPYQQPERPQAPFDPDVVYYEVDLAGPPAGFERDAGGGIVVPLYSDLMLHDMGERLAENLRGASDVENRQFITARLWGVADTAPYLHDGRATTLDAAIRWHDGEARAARDYYVDVLDAAQRQHILDLLASLHAPAASSLDLAP